MPREADLLPDWFVGGAGKRRLLRALTTGHLINPPWTQVTLARAADLHEKHTVHRHLEVLQLAGLLVLDGGAYRLDPTSPLITPIAVLSRQLDTLPPHALPLSRGAR
jgi:hypothetical protein